MLAIHIPTYSRRERLEHALKWNLKIIEEEWPEVKIFISDNGSADGTEQFVSELSAYHRNLRYLRLPENFGSYYNMHHVIQHVDSDYVWLMGDDDLIVPGTLRKIREVVAEKRVKVIAVGNCRYPPHTGNVFYGTFFDLCSEFGMPRLVGVIAQGIAAREVLEQIAAHSYILLFGYSADSQSLAMLATSSRALTAYLDIPGVIDMLHVMEKGNVDFDRWFLGSQFIPSYVRWVREIYKMSQDGVIPRKIKRNFFLLDVGFIWEALLEFLCRWQLSKDATRADIAQALELLAELLEDEALAHLIRSATRGIVLLHKLIDRCPEVEERNRFLNALGVFIRFRGGERMVHYDQMAVVNGIAITGYSGGTFGGSAEERW
ncbi:MAG: glycosyltransferase [Hydrogenophilus sp.]|nr:glycosyltransferase [Hydrogenophilus sp.]